MVFQILTFVFRRFKLETEKCKRFHGKDSWLKAMHTDLVIQRQNVIDQLPTVYSVI